MQGSDEWLIKGYDDESFIKKITFVIIFGFHGLDVKCYIVIK